MNKRKLNQEPIWFVADTEAQTLYDDQEVVRRTNDIRRCLLNTPDLPQKHLLEKQIILSRQHECNRMSTYLLGYSKVYDFKMDSFERCEQFDCQKTHAEYLANVKYWFTGSNQDLWAKMFEDIISEYGKLIWKGEKYKAVIFFHNLTYDIQNLLSNIVEHKIPGITDIHFVFNNNSYYNFQFSYRDYCFELRDSLKIYNQPLATLAKLVGWKKQTEKATYEWFNLEHDQAKLDNEIEYFIQDIAILGAVIRMYRQEFPLPRKGKLTIAGHAEYELQRQIKQQFKHRGDYLTPLLFNPAFTEGQEQYLRKAYYGGFVYASQQYVNRKVQNGLVFDMNSMYPSVMKNRDYPIYTSLQPIKEREFKRWLDNLDSYNLFMIVSLRIMKLDLKRLGVPCIPKKAGFGLPHEIINLNDTKGVFEITVTNIDLYHIIKNYDIEYSFLTGVIARKKMRRPLRNYVLKFEKMKEEATVEHNQVKRTTAKLLLNSVYGKFAQSVITTESKLVEENGLPKVEQVETEVENPRRHNILIAVFITAYARDLLLRAIERINNSSLAEFWYCDTDSVHFGYRGRYNRLTQAEKIANEIGIEYDIAEFGKWKCEQQIKEAVYLGNKRYWEVDDNLHQNIIKGAGIQKLGKKYLEAQGIDKFRYYYQRPMIVPFRVSKKVFGGVKIFDGLKEIAPTDYQIAYMKEKHIY